MTRINVSVHCPIFDSFRVQQVAGMFDVPLAERASQHFRVELPEDFWDRDWRIGLIVGPSASGKTTIARRLFGDRLYQRRDWPKDRAVVDSLGDLPIKDITRLFTAVGFSSPPSWIKPYHVLSNGEQFRCDLARALAQCSVGFQPAQTVRQQNLQPETLSPSAASPRRADRLEARPTTDRQDACPTVNRQDAYSTVAFDEFTSVVDRNVARVVSTAVAKALRAGQIAGRFVAVTCHYDVTDWLQPDWVLDMASAAFQWRSLRRPAIQLEVFRCGRGAWTLFARHHYLSGELNPAARCFLALWENRPVAFCATVTLIGWKDRWRISRIVTLPDYQGIGIGMGLAEAVAELHRDQGHRMNLTASHPAVLAHCRRSPRWRVVRVKPTGSRTSPGYRDYRGSAGRAVMSFEYVGQGFREWGLGVGGMTKDRQTAKTENRNLSPVKAQRCRARTAVLDDAMKEAIVALLSVGCSQRLSARYAGCPESTLRRVIARDPEFAAKVRKAKCDAEVGLMKNIRDASNKEQYWRAAAWMLERNFPDRYARRGPDVITVDQIGSLLSQFAQILTEEVPVARYRKAALRRLQYLTESLSGKPCRPKKDRKQPGRKR